MSRIPLETSLPMQGIGANRSLNVPRQSLLQSLTSPGVTPQIVTDDSRKLSEFFVNITGAAVNTAGQLAQVQDRRRAEIEDENRKYFAEQSQRGMLGLPVDPQAGAEAKKHYDLQSGVRWAKIVADKTEQEIQNGKFNIGADEDIAAAITRITIEESGNQSETFKAAFNTAFREQAAPMLTRAQQRFKDETYESMATVTPGALTSSAQAGLLSAERADQIVEGAMKQGAAFGKTPAEVVERAILPAAKAMAIGGDTDSLSALLPHIEKIDPAQAAHLRSVAEGNARQNAAVRHDEAMRTIGELEQSGPSIDAFKSQVDTMKAAKSITDYEATALTDRYTTKRFQLAAASGRVDEVDAMAKHLSKDPDAQIALANYRDQAVQTSRKLTADRLVASVAGGLLSADDASRNIMGRLERWRKNPNDHLGLPPDMAMAAMSRTEREVKQITEREIRNSQMAFAMQPGNEGKILASPEDDDSLITVFAAMGLADASAAGNGSPIFRGMVKPEAAARQAASVSRVPKPWADSIASAFNGATADSQGLQLAMRSYAALALRSPSLAAQIDSSMNETGRVRAVTLMNEVNRQHQLQVNPETGDPNPEWVKRIAEITPTVLNAKPVEIPNEMVTEKLWGVKNEADARDLSIGELNKALPDSMQKAGISNWSGFLPWSVHRIHVDDDVKLDYVRKTQDAYREQIGSRVRPEVAIANAKAIAADRVLAEHASVSWNGFTYVGGKAPHALGPENEKEMKRDLEQFLGFVRTPANEFDAVWLPWLGVDAQLAPYVESHKPRWDATFKREEDGGVGAWLLIGPNEQPLVVNGKTFAFVPTPEEAATVKQLRSKYENEARKRAEDVQDFISRHNVN